MQQTSNTGHDPGIQLLALVIDQMTLRESVGGAMRGQHGRLHRISAKKRAKAESKAHGSRWVEIGGAIGGLAAGIGLIFTGVVTYYGVRTSQLQLEQQEEERLKEESAQAEKVDIRIEWLDSDPVFAVENYSRQTIRRVFIPVQVRVDDTDKTYLITAETVPPCTTKSIGFAELRKMHPSSFKNISSFSARNSYFTDSKGQRWKQSPSGTEKASNTSMGEELPEDEGAPGVPVYAMNYGDRAGLSPRGQLSDC
ncbi:hypothetical protein [Streptomyces sp. NPDC056632]|uniref:hypothetical protein n=1 Tax=Streptomyces sp. NPDC056632 TaxID=3345884 RepID=UPI0036CB4F08